MISLQPRSAPRFVFSPRHSRFWAKQKMNELHMPKSCSAGLDKSNKKKTKKKQRSRVALSRLPAT